MYLLSSCMPQLASVRTYIRYKVDFVTRPPHASQRWGIDACTHRFHPCRCARMLRTRGRCCTLLPRCTESSFWCWACRTPSCRSASLRDVTHQARAGRAQIRAAIGTTRASPACCQAMSTLLKNVRPFTRRCSRALAAALLPTRGRTAHAPRERALERQSSRACRAAAATLTFRGWAHP